MSEDPETNLPPVAPENAQDAGAQEAPASAPGADVPPDRLAIDPRSEYFDSDILERGVGIRFKGTQRTNVEEYCISQGWVRVQAGKTMDRKGRPLTIKLSGPVEAWFEDLGDDAPLASKA